MFSYGLLILINVFNGHKCFAKKTWYIYYKTKKVRQKMLQLITEKSTDLLCSKIEIKPEERPIYYYGIEFFWSTILSLSSMFILAILFGYVPQMLLIIIFLFLFVW